MRFRDFAEFLELTAQDDRQFLGPDELHRIPETVCALANSSGGWIIAGSELDESGEINVYGLDDNFDAEKLIDPRVSYLIEVFDKVKAIYIEPLKFYMKPLILDGKVYRRVEGVNLISGRYAKALMILDAQEFSRDDFQVSTSKLNEQDINEFRKAVITLHGEYKNFSPNEFLKRCGVFSGKYTTFAGVLMFGKVIRVRAKLKYFSCNAELEAYNIWNAYTDILPKLTCKLSQDCADAFRKIFINALLHSDYNVDRKINIAITSNPPKVLISNPGIIRGVRRNSRLAKMFELSGILHAKEIQRNYTLKQDMLNFRVRAELKLEGKKSLPEPVIL